MPYVQTLKQFFAAMGIWDDGKGDEQCCRYPRRRPDSQHTLRHHRGMDPSRIHDYVRWMGSIWWDQPT